MAIEKYVDSVSGDNTNTGDDPADAWETIRHGVDWFRDNKAPGDDGVLNLTGSFQENVSMNGANYSNITIQAYSLGSYECETLENYCGARPAVGGDPATGTRLKGDVFHITSASGVTLRNLTILLASRGIYAHGADDLTIDNCCIHDHSQTDHGGGFLVEESDDLTVVQCYVWSNRAYAGAGGDVFKGSNATISGTVFWLNEAIEWGGALYMRNVDGVTIEGCTIGGPKPPPPQVGGPNKAKNGGGVALIDCTEPKFQTGPGPSVSPGPARNTISSNEASEDGGGVYIKAEEEFFTVSFEATNLITLNSAVRNGGGIYINGVDMQRNVPELSLKESRLQGNKATDGGGVHATAANCSIEASHLHDNEATNDGGGVHILGDDDGTNLSITGASTLFNNKAEEGGAIYIENSPGFLESSSVSDNHVTTDGGGISCKLGDAGFRAVDMNFAKNTASRGGAVFSEHELSLSDCKFTLNRASGSGGAVFHLGRDEDDDDGARIDYNLDISDSSFTENKADKSGGACSIISTSATRIAATAFASNEAAEGGALLFDGCDLKTLSVTGNTFGQDKATGGGPSADILADGCRGADRKTLFANNTFAGAPQVEVK